MKYNYPDNTGKIKNNCEHRKIAQKFRVDGLSKASITRQQVLKRQRSVRVVRDCVFKTDNAVRRSFS